jgi:hypothetical protein
MSDQKEKAKNLKFAFCLKMQEADFFLFNYSLKFGSTFGLVALILQEALFHYCLSYFIIIIDIVYTYLIIWSVVRLLVAFVTFWAIQKKNFKKLVKCLKGIKVITAIQIFNSLVLLVLALLHMDLGVGFYGQNWGYKSSKYMYILEELFYPGLAMLFLILMNVYTYYILFSFTKHLGLGNEALVFNNRPRYVPQVSLDSRNTSAFLPANSQSSFMGEFSQYPNLEKIVLNYPNDITFAQSAQNAIVNNLVLPSGFKIPTGRDGKSWRIEGNEILLV